jgi:hypothetical protein
MISRVLAAALAAGAASAITIRTYTNSGCTGTPVGSLTMFTNICAPQLAVQFAARQAPVASFSAASVVGGGAGAITSVVASGYANGACSGTAAITATVGTTCAALTGFPGVYAVLSTGDKFVNTTDSNGAFYMQLYSANTCADSALVADSVSGGVPCTQTGANSALQVTVTATGVTSSDYAAAPPCSGTPTQSTMFPSYTFGVCAAGTSQICTTAGLQPSACFVKTSAVSAFPAAAAKSGASAAALSSLVALVLAVAAAAAAAF